MSRRLISAGLFALAFSLIVLGGYQCATRVDTEGNQNNTGQLGPTQGGNSGFPHGPHTPGGDPYREGGAGPQGPQGPRGSNSGHSLPSETGKECNLPREKYTQYEQRYGSGKARFRFDSAGLRDFIRGMELNFGSSCERLYLNMSKSGDRYSGELHLTFEDSEQPYLAAFESGNQSAEIKNNYWEGNSWNADGNDKVGKKFHAIFEGDHAAVILKLEDVRLVDLGDGATAYMGAGKLYYKMFRSYVDMHDTDVCHDEGVYASVASELPPRDKGKCWLVGTGVWSCLPNGVVREWKAPGINIRGNLPCYRRLGIFGNLNIRKAFNVGNVNHL